MSEEQAQYIAVGPEFENEPNRITLLLGRAALACRTLEALIPVVGLPWTVGFADRQGYDMLDTNGASVATLRDPSRDRNGLATRYAHEALIQVPHLVPAVRYLLAQETARIVSRKEREELADLGAFAVAAARARHALEAFDAYSDALGDTRGTYPDERDNNRFWLARGEVRGVLCQGLELAEAALRGVTDGHADEADRAHRLAEADRIGKAEELKRRMLRAIEEL